jgi:hypothetical protein
MYLCPQIGDVMAPSYQYLRCSDISVEGFGTLADNFWGYTHLKITAEYSTFQAVDDTAQECWEYGGEVLETGMGRVWQNAGTTMESQYGVYYPNIIMRYSITVPNAPRAYILACQGKVNVNTFLGCAPETLLLEGASFESKKQDDSGWYYYKVNYSFLWRPVGHNVVWRAPRQARDSIGNLLFDSGTGDPQMVTGAAGTGGWDRPVPALYELADFSGLLGG